MSRNFEVLQQAQKETELFRTPAALAVPKEAKRPALRVDVLAREEETKLVQRVFLLPGEDAPRRVLFCGINPGDGSGAVCARAGEILAAQTPGSVCLVDANLRSPSMHEYFGIDNAFGFADAVLLESSPIEGFAQQVAGSNLWVLPSGSSATDLQALFTTERLELRMRELFEKFDRVLIDAPPANLYGDAAFLGKLADGAILVLKSNSTRRETAGKVKESLEAAGVRLMGAVLNERTFPIPERLYRKL
jgi:Mrp family chromosome partitioning ATPase